MFTSALASVDGGGENRLRLPKAKHSVIILVDGLGYENLSDNKAYARYMFSKLTSSLRCEFPSTTSTSLTGMATGLRSGSHGVIGYSVYSRSRSREVNLLTGWADRSEALEFKLAQDLASSSTVSTYVVAPSQYANTGFTELTMSGSVFRSAETIAERFEALSAILSQSPKSVTYLYIPELDQLAHRFGVQSTKWLEALESLDSEVSRFTQSLDKATGVLLTADHGVLDVAQEHHIYLDAIPFYTDSVVYTAGDPRCNFLYLSNQEDKSLVVEMLKTSFGSDAFVCDHDELVSMGWVTRASESLRDFIPDIYLIWNRDFVAYDRRFAKPHHLRLIGQHGGISDRETRIPLLRFGCY